MSLFNQSIRLYLEKLSYVVIIIVSIASPNECRMKEFKQTVVNINNSQIFRAQWCVNYINNPFRAFLHLHNGCVHSVKKKKLSRSETTEKTYQAYLDVLNHTDVKISER